MGCFGYICKGCGTQIVGDCFTGGEKAKIKHIRDGKILGETVGHYNEYGGVIEDPSFRNIDSDGINGHKEICKSEIDLPLSSFGVKRIKKYRGGAITLREFEKLRLAEKIEWQLSKGQTLEYIEGIKIPEELKEKVEREQEYKGYYISKIGVAEILAENRGIQREIHDAFHELEQSDTKATSGIVAWHKRCYDEATQKEREDLTPSESDPNQSWGEIRDEYR